MHQSSLTNMAAFRDAYLSGRLNQKLNILDLGSMDVNGSYRPLFESGQWRYTGVDLCTGKNVDVVLSDPYLWRGLKSGAYDAVISGQALEHIEYFWLTLLEIVRVLKPGGLCCLIAPSGGYEHRYPVDCWRFYPDGFTALAGFGGLELLESRRGADCGAFTDESGLWQDVVLVARKPAFSFTRKVMRWLMHRIMHAMIPPRAA